jgi:hypothetical protein
VVWTTVVFGSWEWRGYGCGDDYCYYGAYVYGYGWWHEYEDE